MRQVLLGSKDSKCCFFFIFYFFFFLCIFSFVQIGILSWFGRSISGTVTGLTVNVYLGDFEFQRIRLLLLPPS